MQATILQSFRDVYEAAAGKVYIVHSETPAYFPSMGLIEAGHAKFLGEMYDATGRLVTLEMKSKPALRSNPIDPEPIKRSITIGREFFITALKDYDDWPIKWWREAVQNSVDAHANNIDLGSYQNENETWTVYCDDDGIGMDEETIINKFLVLGATTKMTGGTAGGFGKAKELLLLPWISWRIHSRNVLVEGSGIDYTVSRTQGRQGTRLEVDMPPDKRTDGAIALGFVNKCYLPNILFRVDGAPARAHLAGGEVVQRVSDKADIYFIPANQKQSYLYVRTHGLYMFSRYVGEVPGFLIAELTAPSVDLLTANRDGFRDRSLGYAIDSLAERVAKDNMSALKAKQGLIRQKYVGTGKFKARQRAAELLEQVGPRPSAEDKAKIVTDIDEYTREQERERKETIATISGTSASAMLDQKFSGPNHFEAAIKQLVWEPDFFVVNEIENWVVPKKFFPETMTPTIFKLAKTWVEMCRFVMMQLGSDYRFGVGFIFSDSIAASAMTDTDAEGRTEKWLMINPFKELDRRYIVEGRSDIWRASQNPDLKWLYAAAIHEATHIADGLSYHDESFAAALTRNMAKCADGYRKIRQIVDGIRMRGGIEAD